MIAIADSGKRDVFGLLSAVLIVTLAIWVEPSAEKRALLALLGALVLFWPHSSSAGFERARARLLGALALVALTFATAAETVRFITTPTVRVWNVYHYYIGSKYFEELGYTGLYEATLQADREAGNYWADIERMRNLETYEIEARSIREAQYEPLAHFSAERWRSFKRDVEALATQRSPRGWRGIFVDRGYNASPFWTVVGSGLARLAPADRPLALKLICSLDLVALAATFWLLWRGFGLQQASLVLLLFTISPVNHGRLVGGLLQYDWFCAVAAGVSCYRRGRPVAAGGLMAYAVLTRIFPVFFVVSGLVPLLLKRRRRMRLAGVHSRFLVAFAAWCALGLSLSLFNGRGLAGWQEFAVNITTHRQHHQYGERRVGLPFLATHRIGSLDFDESRAERKEIYQSQKWTYGVAAGALLGGWLIVMRRQAPWRAQLLGLAPIFAWLVTSRYYWSYLSLLPLAGDRRAPPPATGRWIAGGQLFVYALFWAYTVRHGDGYPAYVHFNLLLLAYLFAVLGIAYWESGTAAVASSAGRSDEAGSRSGRPTVR